MAYVHMGPPCGTASRAREKKIPQWLKEQGAPEPQPLRSVRFPRGLPGLKENEAVKVEKANAIYDFCCEVAKHCIQNEIGFTIENPTNSYLWYLSDFAMLALEASVHKVSFHACMWGAKRAKRTSLLTNMEAMRDMAKECDGQHEHLPWGVRWKDGWSFATAEECEYPAQMCTAIASRAAAHASLSRPNVPPPQA